MPTGLVSGAVRLETDRLIVREFGSSDADAIQVYAGDAEVTRYTSFGPNTPAQTTAVLANWLSERECVPRTEWPLAIVRRVDSMLVGGTGLGAVNWTTGEAAFGYVLRRCAWGEGFATEAGRAVRDWAFDKLGLRRLVAHCEETNAASLAVLKKLGFSQEDSVILPRANGELRRYLTFTLSTCGVADLTADKPA